MSEGFSDERLQRLQEKFNSPLLEPALLFLSSALPLFTHINQLHQREDPTIHILKSTIEGLGEKLAKRIMLPTKVREISSISETDLNGPENFMDTQDVYLGVLTKNMLKKFLDQDRNSTRNSMMLLIIISSLLLNTFKKKKILWMIL